MVQFLFNIIISLILLVGSMAGCDRVQSRFDQVRLGMTRSEVINLLGTPEKMETKTIGSWTGEVWRWRLEGRTIVLQINDDRVSGKQLAGPAKKARNS